MNIRLKFCIDIVAQEKRLVVKKDFDVHETKVRDKVQGTRYKAQDTRYKVQGSRFKIQGRSHMVRDVV